MRISTSIRAGLGLAALTTSAFVVPAAAQHEHVPQDSVRAGMGAMHDHRGMGMDSMAPMMGRMAAASLSATLAALSDPKAADQLATFTRGYYDALIRKGFSKDEALRIVVAVGIPHVGPGR